MSTAFEWSPAAAAILPTLESLPRDEQRRLGQFLLELGDGTSAEQDTAFRSELLRRSEDLRTGRVAGIPGDEVFQRAREQFR
jgi:putative addiction module component (TIGR02574 family)